MVTQTVTDIETIEELIKALQDVKRAKFANVQVGTLDDGTHWVKAFNERVIEPAVVKVEKQTENETVYTETGGETPKDIKRINFPL
jgi:hypothetical protein